MVGILKVQTRICLDEPWSPVLVNIGEGDGNITLNFPFDKKTVINKKNETVTHINAGVYKGLYEFLVETDDPFDLKHHQRIKLPLYMTMIMYDRWIGEITHLTGLCVTDWASRREATLLVDQEYRIVPWVRFPDYEPDEAYILYVSRDFSPDNFLHGVPFLWCPYGTYDGSRLKLFFWQQQIFLQKWKKMWEKYKEEKNVGREVRG